MGELFVFSAFFGLLLFLFPVFLWTDAYVDVRENKAWFSLGFFRRLRLFGGYAELRKGGIAIHLTKKKAVFLPYSSMKSTRKKFEITKGFQLWRFHQVVEVPGAGKPYGVMLAALIQSASVQAFSVLRTAHPFLSLKNSVLLENRAAFKLSLQTAVVFNGLVLTIAFAKKLLEVFLNWIRKKRSEASWKRQPSN